MIEGAPNRLSGFVSKLANVAQDCPQALDEVVIRGIVFPLTALRTKSEVVNTSRGVGVSDRHLELSVNYTLPPEELDAILQEALRRGSALELPRGQYEARLKTAWTPNQFNNEPGLPPFLRSKTRVSAHATTINPEKLRMLGAHEQDHAAQVELEKDTMTITAKGHYRRRLRAITTAVDPQIATVRVSPTDANMLKQSTLGGSLARQLQPQERVYFKIGIGIGVSHGTQEVIEIIVPLGQLGSVEDCLGKDLFDPEARGASQVVKLEKIYTSMEILRKKRFNDMKRVARILEETEFSSGDTYAIGEEQAKGLLDRELSMLEEFYDETKSLFPLGMNTHMIRGQLVRRLATEYLGEEIVEPIYEAGVEDYITFLASCGYVPGQFETELHLPYSINERNLLEFYKQEYARDPVGAAALYRESYMSTSPSVTVDADVREDGSKIHRLDVASRARRYSFEVERAIGSEGNDDFSLGKISPDSQEANLWTRTGLNGSPLMPLQEWACEKVGIAFK